MKRSGVCAITRAIRDHRFDPAEVRVPAGKKVKLVVHNQDPIPEEFESHELNREKLIAPGTKASIFIGPLKPGPAVFGKLPIGNQQAIKYNAA